jgi:glycosyltransferase involved in cell wall biosynthesis
MESAFSPDPRLGPRRDLRRVARAGLVRSAEGLWVGQSPRCVHRFPSTTGSWSRDAAFLSVVGRWMLRLDVPRFDLLVVWQEAAYHRLLRFVPHRRSAYYASDRYGDNQPSADQERALRACVEAVDARFATSRRLTDLLSQWRPTLHVPHAVDVRWYREGKVRPPPEWAAIPAPRAVFTGVATGKFDFDLLLSVARARPRVQFIVVGPIEPSAQGPSYAGVLAQPNIHRLGSRPYEHLPAYIEHADVLLFPYRSDLVRTFSGLPLKTYEYFMSGRPVLSTPFTELELEPGLIHVEEGASAWAARLDRLLEGEPTEVAERRRALALQNTYEERVGRITAHLASLP